MTVLVIVSVSSRSYILSYSFDYNFFQNYHYISSFRLLSELYSLLLEVKRLLKNFKSYCVSVSSRSYILSYEVPAHYTKLYMFKVSVSSRSYILSYSFDYNFFQNYHYISSFRLLSELYSLLLEVKRLLKNFKSYCVSVSSRSYILSYMTALCKLKANGLDLFPSPLGVIFSLIRYNEIKEKEANCFAFPSPLGVIFSLI